MLCKFNPNETLKLKVPAYANEVYINYNLYISNRPVTGANSGKANITPQTLDPNLETVSRYPDYPIAREARAETARLSIPAGNANDVAMDAVDYVMGDEEEPEDEGKYEIPTANWKSLKLESITSKISRFLRN